MSFRGIRDLSVRCMFTPSKTPRPVQGRDRPRAAHRLHSLIPVIPGGLLSGSATSVSPGASLAIKVIESVDTFSADDEVLTVSVSRRDKCNATLVHYDI